MYLLHYLISYPWTVNGKQIIVIYCTREKAVMKLVFEKNWAVRNKSPISYAISCFLRNELVSKLGYSCLQHTTMRNGPARDFDIFLLTSTIFQATAAATVYIIRVFVTPRSEFMWPVDIKKKNLPRGWRHTGLRLWIFTVFSHPL